MADPCVTTTTSVALTTSGGALAASAVISPDANNGLAIRANGLYASPFVGLVNSLPIGPVDGQEVYLNLAALPGAYQGVLRCRYRAGSTRPYKWDVIGGGPLVAQASPVGTTASATYVSVVGAPTITIPNLGEYEIRLSGAATAVTAATNTFVSYSLGGIASSDSWSATWLATNTGLTFTTPLAYFNAGANNAITPQARSTVANNITAQNLWVLELYPLTVG